MAHSDTIIDGNGIEFLCDTARRLDLPRYELAEILQMNMPWHELGEGVYDGNDGLLEIRVLHAGGPPQRAGACHVTAGGRGAGTILRHRSLRWWSDKGRLA